jgi:hypothetical protein
MSHVFDEKNFRAQALSSSLGSVRIEGLEPSDELLQDFESWTTGELSMAEVGSRLFGRFAVEDGSKKLPNPSMDRTKNSDRA